LGLGKSRPGARRFRCGAAPAASSSYPLFVAAGKLARLIVADHAAALTLVSALSGAAVAAMFYLLDRRHNDWPMALCATLIMALSPLFWLQSGLALTDMFGMVFVLAFLLVEGISARTPQGDLARRMTCGLIAGLSLGAGPHITLLIVAYRREGESKAKPKSETDCDRFRQSLASGHPVLATNPGLCGIAGSEVAMGGFTTSTTASSFLSSAEAPGHGLKPRRTITSSGPSRRLVRLTLHGRGASPSPDGCLVDGKSYRRPFFAPISDWPARRRTPAARSECRFLPPACRR
jgi:hypothetical protein